MSGCIRREPRGNVKVMVELFCRKGDGFVVEMTQETKQLSNPFSTGGGGPNFETRVQAAFTVLMLTGGYAPCSPAWPITKIKLQGKHAGFDTDDMIVFRKEPNGTREARFLAQIKHSISIGKRDSTFAEVIRAAWNDFTTPKVFKAGLDSLAIVTGPLTRGDMEVRTILEWARHSEDAGEFIRNVKQANFSSANKMRKIDVFRSHLEAANGGSAVTDDRLWEFMKSYHLLGYDLDIQSGVILSLLHSLIGAYATHDAATIWALVVDEVQSANQNAGTITLESLSEKLCACFERKVAETIPRDLTRSPSMSVTVDWNKSPLAAELATATLLGGWDDSMVGDTVIASQVAKEDFVQWIPKIREILQASDSPLTLRNGIWTVSRTREMWQTLGRRFFDADIDVFRKAAAIVLSERDPMFELPPDERYMARLHGKVLRHSHELRKGVSETLALLGSQPNALTHCSQNRPETVALLVVRDVLGMADWVLWGSLNDLLPLLAEAAPKEFLDAVENGLQLAPCPFAKLFEQEGGGIAGGNYMTGLLWALETLAWDEEYLSRVAVILGELSLIDPGGNWSNRPVNSLTTIFLPWFPQTMASVQKQQTAIQTLKKEVPSCAWQILLSLMPDQHQVSSGAHKPIWRQIIPDARGKGIPHKEYWEQVSFYADMAVGMAEGDPRMLVKLVHLLDTLPPQVFDKLLGLLGSDKVIRLPEADKTHVWSALVAFTAKHRRYSDADWALGYEVLDRIDGVAKALAPKSPFNLHQHLFSETDCDLYEENGNWQEQEMKLQERRQSAIREVYASGATEEVIRFAGSVESPSQVGVAFGAVASEKDDAELLPALLCSEDRALAQFIASYVWARHWSQGWEWVDKIASSAWSKLQLGKLLAFLPFTSATWTRASRLLGQDESEYWAKGRFNSFQADGDFHTAIDKLLKHGRPYAAIACLNAARHKKNPLDHGRAVRALLAATASDEDPRMMDSHRVVELIKALQEDSQTSPDDLFKIEWAYLPLLDGHRGASPKLLEQRLASEPAFFCEVIRVIFRSTHKTAERKESADQQKKLAGHAYQLLHKWKTPPGSLPDGKFSPEQFGVWMQSVRSECEQTGHTEVALLQIGQVLIHTPPDPDGFWIHGTVAELLNAKDTEQMRQGFCTGVFNSRGAHWVDPTGAPERSLAVKCRQEAEDAENRGYYRLATAIRGLADSYSREAQRIIAEHNHDGES